MEVAKNMRQSRQKVAKKVAKKPTKKALNHWYSVI